MGVMITVTTLAAVVLFSTPAAATVVSDWNAAALAEVRASKLGPPIVARALAIAHTCMYDAWAAYDDVAIGTVPGWDLRRSLVEHTDANKAEAISFAAYRCLVNLFPTGAARLADVMERLGYDPGNTSTDVTTPAGIGNVAAQAVIDDRRDDGSNQYGDLHPGAYSDYTGYTPRNQPMAFCTPLPRDCPPLDIDDPLHWQPLISDTGVTQTFIAPHWESVRPFALRSAAQFDDRPLLVPPPDIFNGPRSYQKNAEEILKYSRELNDERKLIVEYWADGPASELPPGHWGLFAQFVSQRDDHSIDEDVKMFFAMHNASFDAGIVAWHFKRKYDGVRPITAIRYLKRGQDRPRLGRTGPAHRAHRRRAMDAVQPRKQPDSRVSRATSRGIRHSRSASAEVLKRFTGSDHFGFSTVIPAELRSRGAGHPGRGHDDVVRDIQRRRGSGRTLAPVRRHSFQRRQCHGAEGRPLDRPAGVDQGAEVLPRDHPVGPARLGAALHRGGDGGALSIASTTPAICSIASGLLSTGRPASSQEGLRLGAHGVARHEDHAGREVRPLLARSTARRPCRRCPAA